MKNYYVTFQYGIDVEAENEEEAKAKAVAIWNEEPPETHQMDITADED